MSIIAFQLFFPVFLVILGFFVIYIFKKVLLFEIESSFEFYYLSIISSLFICFIAISLYGILIQPIIDLNDLIARLEDIELFALFLVVYTIVLATIIISFIFYTIYIWEFASRLRNLLGLGKGIETIPHFDIWEYVLNKSSYIVVLTKDGKKYYGYHEQHSFWGERMLLLRTPSIILDDCTQEPIENEFDLPIDSIMFFEEDIKRIYIVAKEEDTKK